MDEIKIPDEYMVLTRDSSGSQAKYLYENSWYKLNTVGSESIAEAVVSTFLQCTDINNYVKYTECIVNGRRACCSSNFLQEDRQWISFQKLYWQYKQALLSEDIMALDNIHARREYVEHIMLEITGLDLSSYLDKVLSLDLIILNPDRHFNNLGVVKSPQGFYEAPIF